MYPTPSDRKLSLIQQITELQNDALVLRFLEMLHEEEQKVVSSHEVTDAHKEARYNQSMLQAETDFERGKVHSHEEVEEWFRKKVARG